jgi:hypothetical protein
MSQSAPDSNVGQIQEVTSNRESGRSAGRSDEQGEGGIADADLARLVAAWPTLAEPIRRAMLALIGATR